MALYYFTNSEYLPDVYYASGGDAKGNNTPYKLADGFTYNPNKAYRTDRQMPYIPLTEEERKNFNITNENFDNYYYNLGLAQTGGKVRFHGKTGVHTATPEQLITIGKYIERGGVVPDLLPRGGVFHNGQFGDDAFQRLENQIEQAKKHIEWLTNDYAKKQIAGVGRVATAYSGYRQESINSAYKRLGEAQKAYNLIMEARKGLEEVRGGKTITRNQLPAPENIQDDKGYVNIQEDILPQSQETSSFQPTITLSQQYRPTDTYQISQPEQVVTPARQVSLPDKYLAQEPDINLTQYTDPNIESNIDPNLTNKIDKYLTN